MARSLVLATAAMLALTACMQTALKSTTTLKEGPENRRIVLMPVDIELSLLNVGGVKEPRADWTETARGHVRDGLKHRAAGFESEVVFPANADILEELDDDQVQIVKLANAVGYSILIHKYLPNNQLPTKEDRFDWTLGPDAQSLKDKYGADYALFVFMRDSYSSDSRKAMMVVAALFGVSVPGAAQVAFASLVDLNNGDVVWFNLVARRSGDLRTREAADETVEMLLAEFPT